MIAGRDMEAKSARDRVICAKCGFPRFRHIGTVCPKGETVFEPKYRYDMTVTEKDAAEHT